MKLPAFLTSVMFRRSRIESEMADELRFHIENRTDDLIRSGVPTPKGPVMLDWSGTVAQRFGFRDNLANVYAIDRDGVLRFAASSQGAAAELEPLYRVLDSVVVPKGLVG